MGTDAEYHRTFAKFTIDPSWRPMGPPIPPDGTYHKSTMDRLRDLREQGYEYAKKIPAIHAYQLVNGGLRPIRILAKRDQLFLLYATAWEISYSALITVPSWSQRVKPVVDEKLTVVAHLGWWKAREILISRTCMRSGNIPAMLEAGLPVFAMTRNPMPAYYHTNDFAGTDSGLFFLLTSVDGAVLDMLGHEGDPGLEPTLFPWEYLELAVGVIEIAVAVVAVGGRRLAVRMLTRLGRRLRGTAGAGPTARAAVAVAAKDIAPQIPKQVRKVTPADMLKWEKEGGHALQHHGPQLTRRTLKARILGKEEIPAPQILPGGVKPADLRVWRGQKTQAASKWASDEVMRRAIGETIEKNIDTIRQVTKNGGEVILEAQAVGYTTGSGWVTPAGEAALRTAFYTEELDGVTIVIRARKNFVPTAADPEIWYVYTAFPEMAK